MFQNTLIIFDKIKSEIKNIVLAIEITYYSLIILFFVGNVIISDDKLLPAILLVVTIAYYIFKLFYHRQEKRHEAKIKRRVKKFYNISKSIIRLIPVLATGIAFYTANTKDNSILLLISFILLLGFVITVGAQLISRYVTSRITMMKEAFVADVTKPIDNAKEAFNNAAENFNSFIKEKKEQKRLKRFAKEV